MQLCVASAQAVKLTGLATSLARLSRENSLQDALLHLLYPGLAHPYLPSFLLRYSCCTLDYECDHGDIGA